MSTHAALGTSISAIGLVKQTWNPQTESVAFYTATGITDKTQQRAIDDFVVALKAINSVQPGFVDFATPANSVLRVCYPFVGGTNEKHKFNLIDPRDADDAFRLHYSGAITHDATGFKSNGTTGFADTHYNPTTESLSVDNHGIDVFTNSNEVVYTSGYGWEIGAGGAPNGLALGVAATHQFDAISLGDQIDGINTNDINGVNQIGFKQLERSAKAIGGLKQKKHNLTVKSNTSNPAGGQPNLVLTIAKLNGTAYFTNRTISYVAIRTNTISDAANILYMKAVYAFQKALGRLPLRNFVFEGHSMFDQNITDGTLGSFPTETTVIKLNGTYANRLLSYIKSAVGGSTTDQMIARKATTVDPYYINYITGMKNIIPIWIGCNDGIGAGTIGQGAVSYGKLKTYCQSVIADGWIPVVLTMIPYIDTTGQNETERQAFNTLIKSADLQTIGTVYVLDTDLIPETGDPTNSTYYYPDGIHPKTALITLITDNLVTLINSV